ncbi:MAG: hypothetical protein CMF62_01085 [Magnetococcales bacterium]|nr:hypothetical protein [Magnetococcales bacterium]|tara:strand:- start:50708 stop:51505 length:798 start_codon:yes stop_codon:yes gene_type:complete
MEFYSNSKPDLIANNIKRKFKNISTKKISNELVIQDNFTDYIMFFLREYIEPNKFIIIFVFIVVTYLYYRYENKKTKKIKNNPEPFRSDDLQKLKKQISSQTTHLPLNEQATFNPLYPVANQYHDVNYLPDKIPMRIDNNFQMVRGNDMYGSPQEYKNMIDPKYDYNIPYVNKSRNIYTGVTNTYQNQPDSSMINPLGLPNNQISSDAEFVTGMTNANLNNFKNFKNEHIASENQLINNMRNGVLNTNQESNIDLPYSDEISFDY